MSARTVWAARLNCIPAVRAVGSLATVVGSVMSSWLPFMSILPAIPCAVDTASIPEHVLKLGFAGGVIGVTGSITQLLILRPLTDLIRIALSFELTKCTPVIATGWLLESMTKGFCPP